MEEVWGCQLYDNLSYTVWKPRVYIKWHEVFWRDMKSVMDSVSKKLEGDCLFEYGYVNVLGKNIFAIKVGVMEQIIFVLSVVSDTYLRRQACMYEVGEIIKDHHYKDKLLS